MGQLTALGGANHTRLLENGPFGNGVSSGIHKSPEEGLRRERDLDVADPLRDVPRETAVTCSLSSTKCVLILFGASVPIPGSIPHSYKPTHVNEEGARMKRVSMLITAGALSLSMIAGVAQAQADRIAPRAIDQVL